MEQLAKKYVETIRPIYEREEIHTMLNHATGDEAIFLKFMLGSGFRDQEAQHVCWRDLDFLHSQVRVTAKALWDFRPKNWEERVVPLPSALIDQLQRLKGNPQCTADGVGVSQQTWQSQPGE